MYTSLKINPLNADQIVSVTTFYTMEEFIYFHGW